MRRTPIIIIITTLVVLGLLIRSVFTLLTLLVEDCSRDAIRHAEIPVPNSSLLNTRPHLIPKIIHQTYANASIPQHWKKPQQSCLALHEDYEYKLWTDEKSRQFIEAEYPWFLNTFDSYPHPIQRADSIRYFVLAHFGGIYIDLDDGCNRRLDPLLAYPAWLRRTVPTGISNDVMGAVPQHPFFLRVIDSLQSYHRSWYLPYITIMYSTGPLFLSVIWKEYMRAGPSDAHRVRVLMPDDYAKHATSFFKQYRGSSWHGNDARFVFWMGRHWFLLTVTGFALAGLIGTGSWYIYRRVRMSGVRKGHSPGRPFFSRWRSRNRKGPYELITRDHHV
ncbi:MAG: hypothetical protein M1823_003467 [Watsoniomyces obsoletus]|nr:MAG: hypothetical protein M1823_003467 [Watsoniomyces obsoletus]